MASDSRSATASKPRPKWRDRHLSQLSNDQLEEVQEHRSEAVAAMVGVESQADSHPEGDIDATQKLPQRQAGPSRGKQSQVSDDRDVQPMVNRAQAPNQGKGKFHQASHQASHQAGRQGQRGGQSQNRENQPRHDDRYATAGRSQNRDTDRRHDSASRQDRSDARTEHRPSDDGFRHPRETRSARHDERHDERKAPRRRGVHEGARKQSRSGERHDISPESQHRYHHETADRRSEQEYIAPANKSFVAKLVNFKLQGPLKYGLMAFAIAVMIAVSFLKPIDNSSQSQLDSALARATIGFGLARALNGVISVAQGTEFAVQPAGVGVNFSPGEILDPINDLVERFSWVMLLASSSLGVQAILLEVSSWAGISMLLAGAGIFFLLTRISNSAVSSMADVAGRVLLLMLLVRFLIPLGTVANDWVYSQFLEPRFEQSSQELEMASERIREISTRQTSADTANGSITERAKSFYNSMTSKFDFDGMLNDYKNSAENVSEHAVNLIVVFLLQTIVFPLLFLYLIYRLFSSFLLPNRRSA